MKVINRPESSTLEITYPYHVIRNAKELQNVLEGISRDRVIRMGRIVDEHTFAPQFLFMVLNAHPDARDMGMNMFFVTRADHIVDAKKEDYFLYEPVA